MFSYKKGKREGKQGGFFSLVNRLIGSQALHALFPIRNEKHKIQILHHQKNKQQPYTD